MITIAKIGKTVGLKGFLKLHLDTDFPEQFKKGAKFHSKRGLLEVEKYDADRGQVKFLGYDVKEDAATLTNLTLETTEEATKEGIQLKEGEYFWFDIIGCEVFENGRFLGKIDSIERYNNIDYLVTIVEPALAALHKTKRALIPYNDDYVLNVDVKAKRIETKNSLDLIEA